MTSPIWKVKRKSLKMILISCLLIHGSPEPFLVLSFVFSPWVRACKSANIIVVEHPARHICRSLRDESAQRKMSSCYLSYSFCWLIIVCGVEREMSLFLCVHGPPALVPFSFWLKSVISLKISIHWHYRNSAVVHDKKETQWTRKSGI